MGILRGNGRYPLEIPVERDTQGILFGYSDNEVVYINKEIGKRIKGHREAAGMTQEELGRILGIQKAAVQKIESGQNSNIRADKLMRLCETFRVFPSTFLYGSFPEFWKSVFGIEIDGKDPYLEDMRLLGKLNALVEDRFGAGGLTLMHNIDSLNEEGIERAISYVRDLSKIDEYRKGSDRD